MSRAAFTYKTKDELRQMGLSGLDTYIRVLRRRATVLNGPARKSTQKQLEVAIRVRESLAIAQVGGDA
jgi:hypothetical protein